MRIVAAIVVRASERDVRVEMSKEISIEKVVRREGKEKEDE